MKNYILSVLMVVMLAVPCMAEVEPEGFFSVERTYWSTFGLAGGMLASFGEYGFLNGGVYACLPGTGGIMEDFCVYLPNSFYIDLLLLTIVITDLDIVEWDVASTFTGYLFPSSGFGVGFGNYGNHGTDRIPLVLILTKESDNWTPPSE